jgi:hypothetical protein
MSDISSMRSFKNNVKAVYEPAKSKRKPNFWDDLIMNGNLLLPGTWPGSKLFRDYTKRIPVILQSSSVFISNLYQFLPGATN